MKTILSIFILFGVSFSSFADEKLSAPIGKESGYCFIGEAKNSPGAVIQKDNKNYQCVKTFDKNMSPSYAWIEVKLLTGTQPVI